MMKTKTYSILVLSSMCLFLSSMAVGQSDLELITATCMDYIEGTANGEPDRLKEAFHPDFNLYFVKDDDVEVWSGAGYVGNVKEGQKSDRVGRIISIDYEGDAATAKIEVDMPGRKRLYTDYLLLLKYQGRWRIIHKSFTFKDYPK